MDEKINPKFVWFWSLYGIGTILLLPAYWFPVLFFPAGLCLFLSLFCTEGTTR